MHNTNSTIDSLWNRRLIFYKLRERKINNNNNYVKNCCFVFKTLLWVCSEEGYYMQQVFDLLHSTHVSVSPACSVLFRCSMLLQWYLLLVSRVRSVLLISRIFSVACIFSVRHMLRVCNDKMRPSFSISSDLTLRGTSFSCFITWMPKVGAKIERVMDADMKASAKTTVFKIFLES